MILFAVSPILHRAMLILVAQFRFARGISNEVSIWREIECNNGVGHISLRENGINRSEIRTGIFRRELCPFRPAVSSTQDPER
jgi:hypothetical protein